MTTTSRKTLQTSTNASVHGPHACRQEAEDLLRDLALVLSLTRRVKASIVRENTPVNRIAALTATEASVALA